MRNVDFVPEKFNLFGLRTSEDYEISGFHGDERKMTWFFLGCWAVVDTNI